MKHGSQKQIEWAERIKAGLTWDGVKDHPAVAKAKELILGNDDAGWWIDVGRHYSGYGMISAMLTGGLMIANRGAAKTASIRGDGSGIDIRWTVIVSDGKGGRNEDRSETIEV